MSNHAGTPTPVHRMTNRNAKRILSEAAANIGREVVVIAPGVEGAGYFATSISVGSSQAVERNIVIVNEALKKLKQWHRRRLHEERVMAKRKGGSVTATETKLGDNMKTVKAIKVPFKKSFGSTGKRAKGALVNKK